MKTYTAKQQENLVTHITCDLSVSDTATIEMRLRRPDGALIVADASLDGIDLTTEMLYAPGKAVGEFRATQGEKIIATENFIVEISPMPVGSQPSGVISKTANICLIDKAEYDKISEKSTNTLYYVTEIKGGKKTVTQYLGDIKLSGGSGNVPVNTWAYAETLAGKVSTTTKEDF